MKFGYKCGRYKCERLDMKYFGSFGGFRYECMTRLIRWRLGKYVGITKSLHVKLCM